jgi:hypothetical protein
MDKVYMNNNNNNNNNKFSFGANLASHVGGYEDYCLLECWSKMVTLSLDLMNEAPRHGDVWGSGGITPPIMTSTLDWGEWSASYPDRFTPRGNSSQYPLHRRLGGPQSRHGRYGEGNILCLPGIEPGLLSLPSRFLITILTKLSRLSSLRILLHVIRYIGTNISK